MTPMDALALAGIRLEVTLREDGKLHRFGLKEDKGETPCWYVFHQRPNKVVAGAFGCWKRNFKQRFCSIDRSQLSATEWAEVCQAQKDAEDQHRIEQEQQHAAARERCHKIFSAPTTASHPYLKKKGVRVIGQLVVSTDELTSGWLALPLQDENRVIHSAQFIADDGTKRFLWHGRTQGCFLPIGNVPEGPVVICEGYATGASIHEATGWQVICAMTAGNLVAVAKMMRRLHKERLIIIAADNDQFTESGNAGLEKGKLAQAECKGVLCYPEFADEALADKPTDFNDLHRIEGIGAVKRRLVDAAKLGGDWDLLVEDASDIMVKVIPPPKEVVAGLICEQSKIIIGGSSKTYKTWFTADVSISMSVGCKFLGRECLRRRVLYVNFELKQSTFEARVQTIAHAKGVKFDYQQFFHLPLRGRIAGLTTKQMFDQITRVALRRRAEVIILDPLQKINTGTKNDSESGEQMIFFNQIDRLVNETGALVVGNDHFSKGNQSEKDPLDAIRGSSVKGGEVDAAMIIRAHKDKGSFVLSVVHRELPPVDDFVITWDYPIFALNETLDPAEMKKPKGGRPASVDPTTLLWAFESTSVENGLSVTDLANKIGVSRQSLSQRHLPALRSKGWIATAGEGATARQYITAKGTEILRQLTEK